MAKLPVKFKTFEGQDLFLDNRAYTNCSFKRCKLTYRGGPPPSFENCHFWGNEFVFDGPAGNALAFLQSISRGESGLQSIFVQLFPNVTINY